MRSEAARLDVSSVARLFKALADDDRVRIVALLTHGELCVCHIEAALAQSQPSVSRHLAMLRAAGVVESRRDGNWVYYRLAAQRDPDCRRQLRALASAFTKRETLRRDVARLLKVKGPGACR
jgi:ArsR family transcriptional regulator, arsenate/arsenite/antimonite-responsive transcriptional repressor